MDKRVLHLAALCLSLLTARAGRAELPLLTVAEASDYRATSHHAEVVDFCERLAKASPLVRLGELGTSYEKRKLPVVIVAEPPVATAAEAARSGKLVVFAFGNIHAGDRSEEYPRVRRIFSPTASMMARRSPLFPML